MTLRGTIANRLQNSSQNELDAIIESEEKEKEEKFVDKALKGRGFMTEAKGKIMRARKPRMRTLQYYLCDSCDSPITDPAKGFVVQGNIYSADPQLDGGLIGNNIPETEEPITVQDIKRTVFCGSCFMKAVGLLENPKNEDFKGYKRKYKRPILESQY